MGTRDSRWPAGVLIGGFWLLMMGVLLHRELGGSFFSPSRQGAGSLAEERLVSPRESWMGLFVDDERVGYIHVRQNPEQRHELPGFLMELEVHTTLNLLGRSTALDLTGSVWRPYEIARAEFSFAVASPLPGADSTDFRIEGQLADGRLDAQVLSAGEALPFEVPVDEQLIFGGGFGTTLAYPSLAVGDEVRLESFDPLTLKKSPVRVRCLSQETLRIADAAAVTRRLEVTASGIRSQVWIDEQGDVVQMQTPFGLMLRKISPESLAEEISPSAGTGQEVLAMTAVRPRGQRPFRGARSSLLQISSTVERAFPEDRVQVALGEGRYRLTTPSEPLTTAAGGTGPELERYLAGDAFVQADHPRIRSQAAAITGEETDPWRRALRIHQWVFSSVEKEPVLSIPSALEVLDTRRGDCNEHTVLFAALARAAGLPTRIAIGLVWSEDLDGFYYHAWPEVHVGDWTWMDPTLGQPLADATHVKLLNGGIESWTQLVPYLGQLEIEVLEIDRLEIDG